MKNKRYDTCPERYCHLSNKVFSMSSIKNIVELSDLNESLSNFSHKLTTMAQHLNLSLTEFHCDHIAVRCNQFSTAERWRAGWLQCATIMSENVINGRIITLFDLNEPLQVADLSIDCIELPYPGKKSYPEESWQHIELVVPCQPEQLNQHVLAFLSDDVLIRSDIRLSFSQPVAKGETLTNPTFSVTKNDISIKFHPYSIRDIIASE